MKEKEVGGPERQCRKENRRKNKGQVRPLGSVNRTRKSTCRARGTLQRSGWRLQEATPDTSRRIFAEAVSALHAAQKRNGSRIPVRRRTSCSASVRFASSTSCTASRKLARASSSVAPLGNGARQHLRRRETPSAAPVGARGVLNAPSPILASANGPVRAAPRARSGPSAACAVRQRRARLPAYNTPGLRRQTA
jgi:hypothetical protein